MMSEVIEVSLNFSCTNVFDPNLVFIMYRQYYRVYILTDVQKMTRQQNRQALQQLLFSPIHRILLSNNQYNDVVLGCQGNQTLPRIIQHDRVYILIDLRRH